MNEDPLGRVLGWLGLGIGVAQLVAPRALGKLIGIGEHPLLVRTLGVRGIVNGVGILGQPDPAAWVEARVAGDLMDLALLGTALSAADTTRDRVAAATAAMAGITLMDIAYSALLEGRKDRDVHVRQGIVVELPADTLYMFWHDLGNLPSFMRHLVSVRALGRGRWRWTAKTPLGTTVEWDAEIIDDQPNRRLAWRSLEGSEFDNWGVVSFDPARDGATVVRVEMGYRPPAGALGPRVARLFGRSPERQIDGYLRAFKSLMEADRDQAVARYSENIPSST